MEPGSRRILLPMSTKLFGSLVARPLTDVGVKRLSHVRPKLDKDAWKRRNVRGAAHHRRIMDWHRCGDCGFRNSDRALTVKRGNFNRRGRIQHYLQRGSDNLLLYGGVTWSCGTY